MLSAQGHIMMLETLESLVEGVEDMLLDDLGGDGYRAELLLPHIHHVLLPCHVLIQLKRVSCHGL